MEEQSVGYFGDERLRKVGSLLCDRIVERGTVKLHGLSDCRSEEVSFGRFLRNGKVTVEELVSRCEERISSRVGGRHILAIQDTTELNYQAHAVRTKGLGTVGNGKDRGIFLHPVLAVDADEGECLGLISAEVWLRKKKKAANYADLAIEEKESCRWLRGAEAAKRALSEAAHVTVIADRESDIYEEWARLPERNFDLLTRVCRDRCVASGGRLYGMMDSFAVAAHYELELLDRGPKRPARRAEMALRFGSVTIKRPQRCSDRQAPAEITLYAVDVCEVAPPAGVKAVHWRLLTSHKIDSLEAAFEVVSWYRQRWHIEQMFRTLKRQGLDIESSQLESAEALCKLAVLAVQVAAKTMQLVLARDGSKRPADDAFDPPEVVVLTKLVSKLEGRTEKQRNPHPKESLAWAAWVIARLGGWNGYASESPPGPITMRNGLKAFNQIHQGWVLATMCA